MTYKNEYVLNVDIKNPLTNIVPTFVQYDTAVLIFKIYDNGRTYDLSDFKKAEVFHQQPNGTILYGIGELITLNNGKRAIKYQYSGSEMNQVGTVLTSLTIFSNDDKKISTLPFNVKIVKDLRESAGEQVEKETPLFDQIVGDFEETLGNARQAIQRIETVMETIQDDLSLLENISKHEAERIANEAGRNNNEISRMNNEDERENNEIARLNAEAIRIANENARSQEMANRIHKGTYSPATQYFRHNEVFYDGSTYRCLIDSVGIIPTDTTNWTLVSSKGDDGNEGASIVSSVNGVSPDADGNVVLSPDSLGAASENHAHDMSQITGLTSALSVKLEEHDLANINQQVAELLTLANDLGTAANRNVGHSTGNVPIINEDGKLDVSIIPAMPAIAIEDTFIISYTQPTSQNTDDIWYELLD